METPDPPNDTPGALKQVVLTPHDIPWSLRVVNNTTFWTRIFFPPGEARLWFQQLEFRFSLLGNAWLMVWNHQVSMIWYNSPRCWVGVIGNFTVFCQILSFQSVALIVLFWLFSSLFWMSLFVKWMKTNRFSFMIYMFYFYLNFGSVLSYFLLIFFDPSQHEQLT